MLKIFKKIFDYSDKKTIDIFEKYTKIDYNASIFNSLHVLTIRDSSLKNIEPFSVFVNLKILNLPNNKITKIDGLKNLQALKIIDLRFNRISALPNWIFNLNLPFYWERKDDEREGIFLEGNPLPEVFIKKLRKETTSKRENKEVKTKELKRLDSPKKEEKAFFYLKDKLYPLKRQHLLIFSPQILNSNFINDFVPNGEYLVDEKSNIRINVSIVEYDDSENIINSKQQVFTDIKYIILILKETECCLHPHLLESISGEYVESNIFLVMENGNDNIDKKIAFFKKYNNSHNIIDVYHSFNQKSNHRVKKDIFTHIENSKEPKSLWRERWINVKEEIEKQEKRSLGFGEFNILADKYKLKTEVREEVFTYLKRVGVIKEYRE